jgi:predicted transposase/invertase (TIGR01784 family)
LRDEASRLYEAEAKSRAAGKEENKLEIARKLLECGVSLDIIVKSTGLPQEKINELMD